MLDSEHFLPLLHASVASRTVLYVTLLPPAYPANSLSFSSHPIKKEMKMEFVSE